MSLNWQWSDKMGECTYDNGYVGTLYRGNAFCICLSEDEKTYELAWFFADKQHAKNCLGLNKKEGYQECFTGFGVKKLKLNTKYKETAELVQLLAKAKIKIEIELY